MAVFHFTASLVLFGNSCPTEPSLRQTGTAFAYGQAGERKAQVMVSASNKRCCQHLSGSICDGLATHGESPTGVLPLGADVVGWRYL